jgi:DNA-binding GntR family transcriptional regulator
LDGSKTQPPTAERIAARLTEAVHEHRILPGMKLSEDEVGLVFGVSRTVARQALRALAHDGLVRIERNRGAFVARPDPREAREVFEARALLEPPMARAAAGRAGPGDIAALQRHIADERAAIAAADAGAALKLSGRFHIEIARIAGQATVEAFVRQLVARSSLVIALYWRRREALCENCAHDALVAALRERDGAKAASLMQAHLEDLHAQLDLHDRPAPAGSLRAALAP